MAQVVECFLSPRNSDDWNENKNLEQPSWMTQNGNSASS
jgi:hypothetical protein